MEFSRRVETSPPKRAGTALFAGLGFVLALAMLSGILTSPPLAAAVTLAGDVGAFDPGASLRVPAHGTSEDALDRAGAIGEAQHVVDELSAEKRIDEAWKAAAVADAEARTLRVFKVWVVHLKSAADIGGHGTDLFIFLSETGEFLKFSYNGR